MRCTFCNYNIKDIKGKSRDKLTRRDLASFEFCNNKWICGTCSDDLQEMFYSQ
jgi:rubredoxin